MIFGTVYTYDFDGVLYDIVKFNCNELHLATMF